MIISDLTYLESVAEEFRLVGGIANQNRSTNLTFNETITIKKTFTSNTTGVQGKAVFAENDVVTDDPNALIQQLNTVDTTKGRTTFTGTLAVATKK